MIFALLFTEYPCTLIPAPPMDLWMHSFAVFIQRLFDEAFFSTFDIFKYNINTIVLWPHSHMFDSQWFDCSVLLIIHQIFTGNTLTTLSDSRKYRDRGMWVRISCVWICGSVPCVKNGLQHTVLSSPQKTLKRAVYSAARPPHRGFSISLLWNLISVSL